MPVTPIAHRVGKDQMLLLLRSADVGQVLQYIELLLTPEGYVKETDTTDGIIYGRGNKASRILGGGLSARQEFRLTSKRDGDLALLCLRGTASLATAGAIGISKMRKELARLGGVILSRLAPSASPESVAPEALGRFAPIMTGRQPDRGGEYLMVIILVLIAAAAGGLAAAWALIHK